MTKYHDKNSLAEYGDVSTIFDLLNTFHIAQRREWPFFNQGSQSLSAIKKRTVLYNEDEAVIQFNPNRSTSVLAKTDAQTILKRTCFLCESARPTEQKGVKLYGNFIALCNPMPLFDFHLTIADQNHSPQVISEKFTDFLEILTVVENQDFALFFNGAKSGASAPDHLHFQGCKVADLPFLNDFFNDPQKIARNNLSIVEYGKFGVILIQGADLLEVSNKVKGVLNKFDQDMCNIVGFKTEEYNIAIIPRKAHRPKMFHDGTRIISVATVEMCGLVVTIREEDFLEIDSSILEQVYSEVGMNVRDIEDVFKSQ